jgi:hypothetical protein
MERNLLPAHDTERTLALSAGRTLVVERGPDLDSLRIVAADGQVCLSVLLTPAGPVLRFDGSLLLQAGGDLAVSAQRLALHGREGVAITSEGDVTVQTSGDLNSSARIQNIKAELGNVNLKANDDVRIDGERVLVNC